MIHIFVLERGKNALIFPVKETLDNEIYVVEMVIDNGIFSEDSVFVGVIFGEESVFDGVISSPLETVTFSFLATEISHT